MKRHEVYRLVADSLAIDFDAGRVEKVRETLSSPSLPWYALVQLASNHLVLQTLFRIYRDHDLLPPLPEEVSAEMEKIYGMVKTRNREMLTQSREINEILTATGIIPVFTKGIGMLMQAAYNDPGDRLMADVDLLVHFDELEPAVAALKKNGFTHLKELDPKRIPKLKHFPRIFRPGSLVAFEMHWEPVKASCRDMLNYEMVMRDRIPAGIPTGCFTMSWDHMLRHNFIHGQLEHKAHRFAKAYLRNMYDLLLLAENEDWQEACSRIPRKEKAFASYISLTAETFGIRERVPAAIQSKTSRFFLLRNRINTRYRAVYIIHRLANRIYLSYIRKFFLAFVSKKLRRQMVKNLSSRAWYRQHLDSYRKMLGFPTKDLGSES